ncbi:glycosyltransferase family 4 protein [Lutispora saccharofermentans]|uniref:Glycosyltransferase family 4 protein n=1 Tax=Lutispora saccharofermentans TaxID=3024236 RepID=A0ABT1NJ22_9FIRM|nr:glycosyltransferase family 4 protein [Lutispora saccharofermentans]MCQ1530148.1 glycosyltransferase family 4 protein [Lutispora saccharofermentans]
MRILHIISQKPGETGSGIFAESLLRIGGMKGYEQALIAGVSLKDKKRDIAGLSDEAFYKVVFETEELPFPVPGMSDVMPYESTKYCDMDAEMLRKWKAAFGSVIVEAARSFKPDMIIAHHLWMLTAYAKELLPDIPVIVICHGTDLRQLDCASKHRDYVIRGARKLEGIIALSSHQQDVIAERYGVQRDRIIVAGGGYDESIFYPPKVKPAAKPIKLIYAGKLSFAKGVNSLIEAMSLLPYEGDEISLALAGSGAGAQEKAIMALAKSSPYPVEFLGKISQPALGQAYRESHIFVLPSYYEGLSLVTIEALASGLRVVANDLPGMQQWMGEDIVGSGAVSFVKLPALESIDKPLESEMPGYERRLASALRRQIDEVKAGKPVHIDIPEIIKSRFSWEAVFNKIEEAIRVTSAN